MSTSCPVEHCERPMPGNATICGACSGELARALGDVPFLAGQLDTVLARQTSKAGGGRGAEDPLPFDLRASEAAYILRSTLVGWVRALDDLQVVLGPECAQCRHPSCGYIRSARGPADELPDMSRWLLARHTRLAGHPAAVEAHGELTAAVRAAERAVDRPADRWYAGECGCDTDLYARPGAPTITCRGCGVTWDVAERRTWLLGAAEDVLAYGALIAQALTSLGSPVTPERIRKWAERGRIVAHGLDGRGRPQYRVGDIQDLLREQARKLAS